MPASDGSIWPLTVAAYTPPGGGPEGVGLAVGTSVGVGLAVLCRLGLASSDGVAAVALQALSSTPSSSTTHAFDRWVTAWPPQSPHVAVVAQAVAPWLWPVAEA